MHLSSQGGRERVEMSTGVVFGPERLPLAFDVV
jgi:hypothetical protein